MLVGVASWCGGVSCKIEVDGVEAQFKCVVAVTFGKEVDFDEGVLGMVVLLLVGPELCCLGSWWRSGSCVFVWVGVDEELAPI